MLKELTWNNHYTDFTIAIACVTIGFITYFFLSESSKIKQSFFNKYAEEKAQVNWVLFQKMIGVIWLGVVPLLFILLFTSKNLTDLGISTKNLQISFYWVLALAPIIFFINFLNARKPDNLAIYPQIRIPIWSNKVILANAFGWISYLLAYEILFRGILLLLSVKYLGEVPAIILNVNIYALVHIPKGIKETLGAIPLGFLLCWITLTTQNIWVAFAVHCLLALSNDAFSLYFHPEMKRK